MADELIKITQWREIAKLYGSTGVPMPFVQELFLLECEIAGTGFVKDIEENTKVAGTPTKLISTKTPGRFVNRRWSLI